MSIPTEALDDRLAFVGTSGSGKTYAAGTAVERLLKSGARVVIVDPLDVWWGLRVKADGRTPAYPIVIFGGQRGDVPITEASGAVLGEAVASMAESCIVSLGGMATKTAERRFMLAFLERMYRSASGEPFHLIFDEADLWAPQKSSEPQLQSLMEQIVRRGRVKGFVPWLITQRPAVISKDVLSQADGLVAMKLVSAQDRAALGSWIEGQADRGEEKRLLAKLPTLQRGHGVVWVPARGVLQDVVFPAKETFDSSSTPKRGELKRTATLKPLDIEALRQRLTAATAQQATKSKAAGQSPSAAPHVDALAIRAAEDRARAAGFEDGKRVGIAEGYRTALRETQAALAAMKPPEPSLAALPARPTSPVTTRQPASVAAPGPGISLPRGERAILIALAQHRNGCRREQLTVLTGYKRSSRDTYIQRLKERGFAEWFGDRLQANTAGIQALGSDYDPLPVGAALRSRVLAELPEGERKVLTVICDAYPATVDRASIDEATGYKRSSRYTYLQRLRSRELIDVTAAGVRASDDLFQEAA